MNEESADNVSLDGDNIGQQSEDCIKDSVDNISVEGDNEEESEDSNDNDLENKSSGNSAWADAMCRVLNTNVTRHKNFILSKAKKDTDIKVKAKEEIEIIDESGNVLKTKKIDELPEANSYKAKRVEMLEKQKQKAAWENMCRVKPDIIKREMERELVRIATKGVVHLFNTVEKHQKSAKDPKEKDAKRKEKLGTVKGNFMDILKGHSKRQQCLEDDPAVKKVKQEETWNILKDDFMMGAEMKDWDKHSDND